METGETNKLSNMVRDREFKLKEIECLKLKDGDVLIFHVDHAEYGEKRLEEKVKHLASSLKINIDFIYLQKGTDITVARKTYTGTE